MILSCCSKPLTVDGEGGATDALSDPALASPPLTDRGAAPPLADRGTGSAPSNPSIDPQPSTSSTRAAAPPSSAAKGGESAASVREGGGVSGGPGGGRESRPPRGATGQKGSGQAGVLPSVVQCVYFADSFLVNGKLSLTNS